MNDSEIIRKSFKPEIIKILFIGESPPNNGTFFYLKNSNLFDAVKKGFENIFGKFKSDDDFLLFFKNTGCYLDDLCLYPVNHLNDLKREEERIKSKPLLIERIKSYKPFATITVMKGIEPYISQAIKESGVNSIQINVTTSFPVRYERNINNCISDISQLLKTALSRGIIKI